MRFVAGLLLAWFGPTVIDVEPMPDSPGMVTRGREWQEPRAKPAPISQPGSPATDPVPVDRSPFLFCRNDRYAEEIECVMPTDPEPTAEPEVTPGDVERAVKRVGLPRLKAQIQPPGTTLVNLDTIFHTTADPFERTVQILDSTVVLRATPATYTWHHGDGTSQTKTTPGRPYPATDVTHQYRELGRIHASVDVTYSVTYRIDDSDWQELDTTITAAGPPTALRIREARPVLTR